MKGITDASPEKRQDKEKRELERLKCEQARPKGSGYMIYFIIDHHSHLHRGRGNLPNWHPDADHPGRSDLCPCVWGGVCGGPDEYAGNDNGGLWHTCVSLQAAFRSFWQKDIPGYQYAWYGAWHGIGRYCNQYPGLSDRCVRDRLFHSPRYAGHISFINPARDHRAAAGLSYR